MNILKPSTWFKKEPASHVFLQLDPERPHQGLDHFSAEDKCAYKTAIKVIGISSEEARLNLVGKVLNWEKITDKQWKAIESGKPPEIPYHELKSMFR